MEGCEKKRSLLGGPKFSGGILEREHSSHFPKLRIRETSSDEL